MEKTKLVLTEAEKVAREIVGTDTNSELVTVASDQRDLDKMITNQAKSKYNQAVGDLESKLEEHDKLLKKYKEEVTKDINNMDMSPLYNYVVIKPFSENPFQQIKREGALITDLGGLTPTYKSNEDGGFHEEESFIHTGMVTIVGPECKYTKEGDLVMWPKTSEITIPFYKEGLMLVNETRIMVRLRESDLNKKNK